MREKAICHDAPGGSRAEPPRPQATPCERAHEMRMRIFYIRGGKDLIALSLFSGIGGLDLAAEMAGIKVKAFCEIELFPVEVLKKRFPGVPIFEDVRELTAEVLRDRTGMDTSQSIDIVFGGFPCQDLSQAGKQVGLTGARSGLWFEMLRVIHEIRPRYVVAENVRGAVNLALDTVYAGMEDEGYKVWAFVLPASAVGAPHQRERLFVVGVREDVHRRYTEAMANTRCELRQGSGECRKVEREAREGVASDSEFSSGTLWPTPQAVDGSAGGIISPDDTYVQKASGLFRKINRNGTDGSVGLARMVKLWPTPSARDYKDSPGQKSIDTPRP
ncbi:MAG: DNA cytosine methyltransferase, partial [Verrucomicrobiae bacterium]|nr:DNA cytosine methyltransferase [Verrucomicrobiae bacterium]